MKTVVLFFDKGAPTRKVWYYQLDPGRNMGKTNPLNDDDLAEFVEAPDEEEPIRHKSWTVDAEDAGPGDLRPVREEPQRRRGSRRTARRRRSWTRSRRWTPRAPKCWRGFGGCCEERVANEALGDLYQIGSGKRA